MQQLEDRIKRKKEEITQINNENEFELNRITKQHQDNVEHMLNKNKNDKEKIKEIKDQTKRMKELHKKALNKLKEK